MTPSTSTRSALHMIAAHILARRRFVVSGRFGLRAAPGGMATPAFGEAPEVVRITGLTLVREVGASSAGVDMNGATLRDLAAFVGVDLDEPFDFGSDAPPVGASDVPFDLSLHTVREIADWFSMAWTVLDDVLASLGAATEVATIQLWPEHFDAATTVTLPSNKPVTLGFSPGDRFEAEPYLYVSPWDAERPGDPSFWNVSFGAMRRRSEVLGAPDPAESCRRFLREGMAMTTSR